MRKKDKVYSIIVVSGATTSSRKFSVSERALRVAAGVTLVFLALSGFAVIDSISTAADQRKLKQLQADVVEKDRLIADLSRKVETLDLSIQRMEVYTDRILVAAGLKSPLALREVGSGGPIEFRADPIVPAAEAAPVSGTGDILGRASQLDTKSRELESTLKYVRSVIDKQKMRLASTPSIWPTRGYLTDGFGERRHPITGKRDFHHGLDIATQLGNRVIAPANGLVLCAEKRSYYGNLIIIDHGYGFTTRYGHLASFNVKEGQRVKRGDVIGYVGSTGMSSAPHLHYEVRVFGKPRNPLSYMID